jgi:hypothetical protein
LLLGRGADLHVVAGVGKTPSSLLMRGIIGSARKADEKDRPFTIFIRFGCRSWTRPRKMDFQ